MTHVQTGNTKIVLVDDHKLFRKGLAELINAIPGYGVVADLNSGVELQNAMNKGIDPQLALLDINIPVMDGFKIAAWLKDSYPSVRVLAVSMDNNEQSILRMIKAGARGYILKDADPDELKNALDAVVNKGYYHSELVSASFFNSAHNESHTKEIAPSNKELEFLELACSDLTYKEIADRMNLAPRTIDGYREALFQKLNVKSRVGLAIYAIKNNLIQI